MVRTDGMVDGVCADVGEVFVERVGGVDDCALYSEGVSNDRASNASFYRLWRIFLGDYPIVYFMGKK